MQYPSMCQKICYEAHVFLGYLKRGIACLVSPFEHEQYPFNNFAHGVIVLLNKCVVFLLGFVKVTQYFSKFQKIWCGAQTISRLPMMGYCTFIEYFVLWIWVQHTLNASKLNWLSFVLLWLSTWFVIPPWKTLF
jgi:hypothetical protein